MKRDRPHEEKEEDGDREKKRLIITIPKKAFEGQQIKRLRVDQEKKILQYFENMRQNDRKREDDDEEAYEKASRIRDEINVRKSKK